MALSCCGLRPGCVQPGEPFSLQWDSYEESCWNFGEGIPGCLRICFCYLWKINKGKPRFFLLRPDCCLDSFSAKLKAVVGSPEGPLEEDTLLFLSEVFDRVVPTSTFIERAFARLNRWCDRKVPKPKLTTLAGKHVCYHFKNLTEQWRKKLLKSGVISKGVGNKARPTWAHGVRRGMCKNGLHVLAREMGLRPSDGLIRQWSLLNQDERQRYGQLARAENAQAKALANLPQADDVEHVGGFWQMSSSEGFPMSRHLVVEATSSLRMLADEFRVRSRSLQPDGPDSLEGAPETNLTLWAGCKRQGCPHGLGQVAQASFQHVHQMLLDTIMRKGPKPTDCVTEPFVLELRSNAISRFVVVAYSTRKKPIEAALVELQPVEADPGLLLVLACQRAREGHLHVMGARNFACPWHRKLRAGKFFCFKLDLYDVWMSSTLLPQRDWTTSWCWKRFKRKTRHDWPCLLWKEWQGNADPNKPLSLGSASPSLVGNPRLLLPRETNLWITTVAPRGLVNRVLRAKQIKLWKLQQVRALPQLFRHRRWLALILWGRTAGVCVGYQPGVPDSAYPWALSVRSIMIHTMVAWFVRRPWPRGTWVMRSASCGWRDGW